jgi:hydroxymethylglutaryl-CoA lyase
MSASISNSAVTGRDAVALRWVECPRDAWQALPVRIPADRKRAQLRALLDAGFRHLDLGSFVSPRAVPQMADTEEVLAGLDRPADADFLCIVANRRGLERAAACGSVSSVGYPLSVNETFQRRNSGMGLDDSWRLVSELLDEAERAGLELVVYLSMGFGNPYGDPWQPGDTAAAALRLAELGVGRVALADTAGTADPRLVSEVLAAVGQPERLGLHLHARPEGWRELVSVAWDAGVIWFEGALAGVGGCPFAGDELVGNLPTEQVLPWLAERGGRTTVDLAALATLAREAAALSASGSGADGA